MQNKFQIATEKIKWDKIKFKIFLQPTFFLLLVITNSKYQKP